MSTFDGRVAEFPDIRIDNFRASRSAAATASTTNNRPVLAYFLSHIHTDHTVGLETCHGPFIYCSAATKALLLKLEKFPHRMNFARGVLESRRQTFRAQARLLKAIPLCTPTELELRPGFRLRVTLLDANHCVGAVMFLIEGEGKAVLYTGDVRAEKWWVDGLVRQPVMAPYVAGASSAAPGSAPLKRLDCVYLDTTFVAAGKLKPYRIFPSKAEGVRELLGKVAAYPSDTLFYLDSWTFGYEEVWEALAAFLGVRVHVDDYRYGLYKALTSERDIVAPEASRLVGFVCGNHFQPGCLTREQTRLHSCEYGTGCDIFKKDFVRITPIVTRHEGTEYIEAGAGGGQGDLDQRHELDVADTALVGQLMGLCATRLKDQPQKLAQVLNFLSAVINGNVQSLSLEGSLFGDEASQGDEGELMDGEEFSLNKLALALGDLVAKQNAKAEDKRGMGEDCRLDGLPNKITFPYSRHASYSELCLLLEAFQPKDIFPCTVDSAGWTPERSMSFLFGHLYTGDVRFRHDQMMLQRMKKQQQQQQPPRKFAIDSRSSTVAGGGASSTEKRNIQRRKSQHVADSGQGNQVVQGDTSTNTRKRKVASEPDIGEEIPSHPPVRMSSTASNHSPTRPPPPPSHSTQVQVPRTSTLKSPDLKDDPSDTSDPEFHVWLKSMQAEGCSKAFLQSIIQSRNDAITDAHSPSQPKAHQLQTGPQSTEAPPLSSPPAIISPTAANDSTPSPSPSHDPENKDEGRRLATRLALQQEVWDAILGRGDLRWADIGLVSVGGHHLEREEEL